MSGTRHGTVEELLAVRDGEGSGWAREHVAGCPACAAELERLEQVRAELRALPSFAPPRDVWPVVREAARRERSRRRVSAWMGLAAAAAVVVLGFAVLHRTNTVQPEDVALRQAMAESAAMEQMFESLHPDRRALSGQAASVVADLEDQLAQVDAALNDTATWRSDPDRVAGLWKQRAGLLSALVDVHETRASVAGL
jgi:anti-sigma factor RsiW